MGGGSEGACNLVGGGSEGACNLMGGAQRGPVICHKFILLISDAS